MCISPKDFDGPEWEGSQESGAIVLNMLKDLEKGAPEVSPENALKALDLMEMSADAEDDEEGVNLLFEALDLDPTNVDIHLELLDIAWIEDEYMIPILESLKSIAAEKLGKQLFEEAKGHFWLVHETRPYMRVLAEIAEELHYQHKWKEAVAQWEEMLQLNPQDNQGARHHLLITLVALGKMKEADALFERYDEIESHCCFSWGKALQTYLQGSPEAALSALKQARKQNRYVESYLKGTRKVPYIIPDNYASGTREEAEAYLDFLMPAWKEHPKAMAWLKKQKR